MRRMLSLLFALPAPAFALGQLLPTPDGSVRFGTEVVLLPNGNFVVTDPEWSDDPDVAGRKGAAYLYAADGTLISRLTGSSGEDKVGSDGIIVLANGNFLVHSSFWDGPGAADAGAVTWGDADTGFAIADVVVSSANSLVGNSSEDRVGSVPAVPLPLGHYVVATDQWDSDIAQDAGAVTWGDGDRGVAGTVGAWNSLVGTHPGDHVGSSITVLSNGGYVVTSPFWDTDAVANVGAVTLRPADESLPGFVSEGNSMVGTAPNDQVGSGGTVALQANVAFASPQWDRNNIADAGAVTWMSVSQPVAEAVDIDNSLVGTSTGDRIGSGGLIALEGGNYAFASPDWAIDNRGALSRGFGDTGSAGVVDATNSVVGSKGGDSIGSGGLTALPEGNFVAISPLWDDGMGTDFGAVSWVRGNGVDFGPLDGATALRGTHAGDFEFARVTVLANGNYVVGAPFADIGDLQEAGAVTLCPGHQSCASIIGSGRSLTGSRNHDAVGSNPVVALPDGNFVVTSPFVDTAQHTDAGAATWGDGESGVVGKVDAVNSLLGGGANDQIGAFGAFALHDGRYLVQSPRWDRPGASDVGAVTLGPAGQPVIGTVQESNSIWGSQAGDMLGWHLDGRDMGDGRAIFTYWRNADGNVPLAGAVALLDARAPLVGEFDPAGAIAGGASQGGPLMNFDYHAATSMLVVGDPLANRVWLAPLGTTPLPAAIFHDGFED